MSRGSFTTYVNRVRIDGALQADLAATSSVKSIATLPSLSLPYSKLTGTPSIPAYPFVLTGNATSTLTQFNGGLTAYASSTISALTAVTGTTTSATSTNFFATTASTTNFFGAGLPGAGCSGTNFLQWSAGAFGCGTPSGSGSSSRSSPH